MPRSNWKGSISFGLVSIPIMLFNSEEPSSHLSFKQINLKTGSRIKYKRIDEETEKEVPWEEIGKGYEYQKGSILPLEEDQIKRVAGENARTIPIEEFVDKKSIDFIDIEKTYYLVPEKKGEKGYVILREALKSANKIGIAKVIISTKEYLAAVATYENALVLYLLHYSDEIRKLSEFDIPSEDIKKYKVNNKEIDIAKKLINAMSAKWKPDKFKDEFKEALTHWINDKIHNKPETIMPSRSHAKGTSKVVNFVDLLKQSLNTSKSNTTKKKRKARTTSTTSKKVSHRRVAAH